MVFALVNNLCLQKTLMDTRGRPNFNAIVVDHEAPMHASRGGEHKRTEAGVLTSTCVHKVWYNDRCIRCINYLTDHWLTTD